MAENKVGHDEYDYDDDDDRFTARIIKVLKPANLQALQKLQEDSRTKKPERDDSKE